MVAIVWTLFLQDGRTLEYYAQLNVVNAAVDGLAIQLRKSLHLPEEAASSIISTMWTDALFSTHTNPYPSFVACFRCARRPYYFISPV